MVVVRNIFSQKDNVNVFKQHPRLFSHDSKVRNFNFNSKCAFWIKILKDGILNRVYAKSHRDA